MGKASNLLMSLAVSVAFLGGRASAQQLQIIGVTPQGIQICNGPLGPGPCADIARFLAANPQYLAPAGSRDSSMSRLTPRCYHSRPNLQSSRRLRDHHSKLRSVARNRLGQTLTLLPPAQEGKLFCLRINRQS
jgi:hypothetical protein